MHANVFRQCENVFLRIELPPSHEDQQLYLRHAGPKQGGMEILRRASPMVGRILGADGPHCQTAIPKGQREGGAEF